MSTFVFVAQYSAVYCRQKLKSVLFVKYFMKEHSFTHASSKYLWNFLTSIVQKLKK